VTFVIAKYHQAKTKLTTSTFADIYFIALFNVLNITLSFWLGSITLSSLVKKIA